MEQTYSGSEKIGDIVTEFPGASNVFKEYSIDFCCGGNQSLSTAIREGNKDEAQILFKLNQAYYDHVNREDGASIDWPQVSSSELIDHIVNTHHAYLQKELPILSEFVTKILRVHGPTHGNILSKLHRLFYNMKIELDHHLIAEETEVFPLIKQYEQDRTPEKLRLATKAISDAEAEHSDVGDILKEMRAVTQNYKLPEGACRTYTLTFQKLEELEADLFQHIHLENNILFPRTA